MVRKCSHCYTVYVDTEDGVCTTCSTEIEEAQSATSYLNETESDSDKREK